MYTVPKKFEIKSSSFHNYDTVADAFDGTLLLYQLAYQLVQYVIVVTQ